MGGSVNSPPLPPRRTPPPRHEKEKPFVALDEGVLVPVAGLALDAEGVAFVQGLVDHQVDRLGPGGRRRLDAGAGEQVVEPGTGGVDQNNSGATPHLASIGG